MKTKCPEPRSRIAGTYSRDSTMGARRFTSSTRSIWSSVKDSSAPGAGHRRVRDDDVDVRVRLGQRADGVAGP